MELGNKIKTLRLRAGMTQEMLADELGVTFQTISKWENNICAPDIAMLPKLSVYFGVTIDELFNLTTEQRLRRIGNMLDMEQELPHSTFVETVEFLQEQLESADDKGKIYSLMAHTYHHRMLSDSEKVGMYARKSLQLNPGVKDCQWLFQKAEGAVACDWNIRNHHSIISFYKELIEKNPEVSRNYLYLMDNLLADHRTKETSQYLKRYAKLEDHMEFQVVVYEARIAFAEHDVALAHMKLAELEERFSEDGHVMFELANFYADQCEYDKAIAYYKKSVQLDKKQKNRPVYTDACHGMALIYEIQEKYTEAMTCYDRMLQILEEEFGITEGEAVRTVNEEKQRLMKKVAEA